MNVLKIEIPLTIMFLLCFCSITKSRAQQKFEKAVFYNTMDFGSIAAIDDELLVVKASDIKDKSGYEGALLMKEASLIKRPKKKLDLFKEGRIKLETALLNDRNNTEFHFLRLAIEEHAPKIVKYHADIEIDKAIVIKNFKNLSPAVRQAIQQYCKKSRVLRAEEL